MTRWRKRAGRESGGSPCVYYISCSFSFWWHVPPAGSFPSHKPERNVGGLMSVSFHAQSRDLVWREAAGKTGEARRRRAEFTGLLSAYLTRRKRSGRR